MIDRGGHQIHYMPADHLVTVTPCKGSKRHRGEPGRVMRVIKLVPDDREQRVIPAEGARSGKHEHAIRSQSRLHRPKHRARIVEVLNNVSCYDRFKTSQAI